MAGQALRKAPFGDDTPEKGAGQVLKRQAPESKDLLKELDTASKQQETVKAKTRRILESCGCL